MTSQPIEETNILEVYAAATAVERAAGAVWYSNAREFCEQLAARYSCDLRVAVGIVAQLSPGSNWDKNQRDAELTCAAFHFRVWATSKWFPKVGTYGKKNRAKCEEIWRGKGEVEPSGQKVYSFYYCILGEYTAVVIDRHAFNLMTRKSGELKLSKNQYQRVQQVYLRVADQLQIPPAVLQAITWVVWRSRSEDFLKEQK